ncbi:class I SAM-dependent methyltransferase [Paraburkholderia caribensis]|uniref:Methyltransferase type 11 n=2 Tax=Paraburkholderia TaxID=1822464 RepID=B2JY76_PARP8|nr:MULTISPECIES: class I SAM-dependent methyltransferase [Paraburkholderia]ACC76584.1 Methyltransferase type 11 [Paraburkholderia phymatum STM815]MCO4880453.1 class I SAM-dependent methyltransferase [Paraburkholderia caribensis]
MKESKEKRKFFWKGEQSISDERIYGEIYAPIYGEYTNLRGKVADAYETVAFLEQICGGRNALELGIGDGRVAVPLSERGIKVEGIDNSRAMLELVAKRSALIKLWQEDIANFRSDHRYRVVYCIYCTFMLLSNREAQIACLRAAEKVVDDEGVLVIEVDVPNWNPFVGGERTTSAQLVGDDNAM